MSMALRTTFSLCLSSVCRGLAEGLQELLIGGDTGWGGGGLFLVPHFVEEGLAPVGKGYVGYL